jgi:hypothetical protein
MQRASSNTDVGTKDDVKPRNNYLRLTSLANTNTSFRGEAEHMFFKVCSVASNLGTKSGAIFVEIQ